MPHLRHRCCRPYTAEGTALRALCTVEADNPLRDPCPASAPSMPPPSAVLKQTASLLRPCVPYAPPMRRRGGPPNAAPTAHEHKLAIGGTCPLALHIVEDARPHLEDEYDMWAILVSESSKLFSFFCSRKFVI
jgi:hypothetical protein